MLIHIHVFYFIVFCMCMLPHCGIFVRNLLLLLNKNKLIKLLPFLVNMFLI